MCQWADVDVCLVFSICCFHLINRLHVLFTTLRSRRRSFTKIRNQQKLFVFAHKQRTNVFAGTENNGV